MVAIQELSLTHRYTEFKQMNQETHSVSSVTVYM